MMRQITTLFPVVLLAAVAAVTVWLNYQTQVAERAMNGRTRHDPDYMVDNFSATRLGPDGLPRYKLSARRMVHYPDDDTTHLDAPRFVSFKGTAVAVTATSKTATLSSNGEDAYLSDDVRLVRAAYPGRSEMTMQTSWLHVVPDRGIARTDQPVRISDANTLITSVGLEFNNETRILKLPSNVRGRYEMSKQTR